MNTPKKLRRCLIHSQNKHTVAINDLPIYNKLEKRKNVLLLGDGIGDLGMIEGFDYDNLIKIGFLNSQVQENLEYYKQHFDVVVANDASFEFVNSFVNEFEILKSQESLQDLKTYSECL